MPGIRLDAKKGNDRDSVTACEGFRQVWEKNEYEGGLRAAC